MNTNRAHLAQRCASLFAALFTLATPTWLGGLSRRTANRMEHIIACADRQIFWCSPRHRRHLCRCGLRRTHLTD